MARTVSIERSGPLVTLRLARAHGNAINDELVRDLGAAIHEVERDDGVRGTLLAASGKLFCPGLDLKELIELDREDMGAFLDRFVALLVALHGCPKPAVAAIGGHAVAGGCILALTCDWRMLRAGARIGLAEVRIGLPLPYPVAALVAGSVGPASAAEVALFGRDLEGEHAVAAGLAHEVCGEEGFEDRCLVRLDELASKEPVATAGIKRYLREPVLERMRSADRGHREAFLDAWFDPPTRERIRATVAHLSR
jgi:enoyl-CoA hydratase